MNTCSVREKAQEKVFSLLGEWRQLKAQRPEVIIGVGGCVASQEGEAITARAPFVDLVFGPQTLHRLPDMIAELRRTGRAVVDVSFPEIEKFDHLPAPRAQGVRAFVSIMEGCSKYCSFCIVPYTRGEEVSRPFASVLEEVRALAAQGVARGDAARAERQRLPRADGRWRAGGSGHPHPPRGARAGHRAHPLHHLASAGVRRQPDRGVRRTSTSSPTTCTCRCSRGSDRVLALMKRGYTTLEFKDKVRRLRAVRPDISLSSDFIVGFPGETERDFEATLALMRDVGFDQSFSFIYSRRPARPPPRCPMK